MANGLFQYNILIDWLVTNDNVIGASSNATLRPNSVLPHPLAGSTDDNVNTIYLDPANGDDGNTGTDKLTDAVLTKTRAEALVTATRFAIHIERTDAAISTTFSDIDLWTPTSGYSGSFYVQVASGQTAIMEMDGVSTAIISQGLGSETLHGFTITSSIGLFICGSALAGGLAKTEYCTITAPDLGISESTGGYSVQNCKLFMTFSTGGAFLSPNAIGGTVKSLAFDNNILAVLNYSNAIVRATVFNLQPFVVTPSVIAATTLSSCTHNTFYNIGKYIHITAPSGTPVLSQDLITGDHKNNIISKADILVVDDNDPGNVLAANYNFDWFFLNHGSNGLATFGTNNITDQSPRFRNINELDFTPAHVSDQVNGVFYPQSSAAIGAADDSTDLGAIQRTFVNQGETVKTHTLFDCGYDLKMGIVRKNFQDNDDIQGNYHATWDDIKSRIELKLSNDYWVGHAQTRGIDTTFRTKGGKRFYPEGVDGLFAADITLSGSNDQVEQTVVITLPQASLADSEPLPRWLTGWVVKLGWIDGGAKLAKYLITDISTDGTDEIISGFFLRGDVISSDSFVDYDFNILYMPFQYDKKLIDLITKFYSTDSPSFIKSAASSVNQTGELHTLTLSLNQTSELRDEL